MPWNVYYFKKVIRYLDKLPNKDQAKIRTVVKFLRDYGPLIKPPFAKKISNNLFELRIKGQDSYRMFYTCNKSTYYLVHIFKKKSQRIPKKEIKTALDRIKKII